MSPDRYGKKYTIVPDKGNIKDILYDYGMRRE